MKIQNTNRRSKISMLAIALAMLAMLACAFTLAASADDALPTKVEVKTEDFTVALDKSADGVYQKVYDGTTDVTVTLNKTNAELGIAAGDDVQVVATAAFLSKDVIETNYIVVTLSLEGADANKYQVTPQVTIGADILPKKLTWETNKVSASANYQADSVEYAISFEMPKLNGLLDADKDLVPAPVVSLQTKIADASKPYVIQHPVYVGANYFVDDLTVSVVINPVVITSIEWAETYEYACGDSVAEALDVFGLDAAGNRYLLKVVYPEGYAAKPGEYTISVDVMSAGFAFDAAVTTKTAKVVITATEYEVSMNSASYVGNVDTAELPTTYMLSVIGDLPVAIRNKIVYTVDGKEFNGTSAYGVYSVVAKLPSEPAYIFVDANGNKVTELKATLTVNKSAVIATGSDEAYSILIDGKNGVPAELTASVSIPEIANKAVKNFPNYKAYSVTISNSQDADYTVKIAVHNDLINNGVLPTVDDLYLYDPAKRTMVKVNGDGRKVMISEGYYEISGLYGDGEWVFVLAPVHVTNFWLTATGIAIILLLILALIVLMAFIGARVRRSRANAALLEETAEEDSEEDAEDAEEAIDQAEEEPEAEAEPEAEEAVLEQVADDAAVALSESVEPEAEPTPEADAEKVEAAAEEAIEEFTQELREEVIAEEAVAEEIEEPVEESVEESVPEEEPAEEVVVVAAEEAAEEPVEEPVEEPAEEETFETAEEEKVVVSAMEAVERKSEDEKTEKDEERTVETFAEVAEVAETAETSEDDDDEDDDDDADENEDDAEDSFGGFNLSGLDFIDISADPEAYAALLAQEKNGEVQLAYRYRRSYQSRLAQSQGRVQDYYSVLKNALLSYKGVKGRISWNYEAFNKGRTHLAKMNAKTKTLYLYLALDPAELVDTKYGIVDVSSKKKYASVPVLLKIKGDRKFKYALELIDKMCAEKMELPKRANAEDVDYRVSYQTTEELVEAGVVKKLVAAIPVSNEETEA